MTSGASWALAVLPLLLAPLVNATEYAEESEYDLDGSGSAAPGPGPSTFKPLDWVIASGTTAIVAVCICAGIISLKPWNDATCVACVDGCAFKTLFCQNILDAIVCVVFVGALHRTIALRLTAFDLSLHVQRMCCAPSTPTH